MRRRAPGDPDGQSQRATRARRGDPALRRASAPPRARRGLIRLPAPEVSAALAAGGLLIDIRPEAQRRRDGSIPDAVAICRNVLEWRCDPSSPWRDELAGDPARRPIIICDEGFQSSLAAASLQALGRLDATDVVGGFRAWRSAGLPVLPAAVSPLPPAP